MRYNNITFLFSLLLILLGSILFLLNAKSILLMPNALLIAAILMIMPMIFSLSGSKIFSLTKNQSLIIIFIPLIIYNYIYYLTQHSVVGFSDTYYNLALFPKMFSASGYISFDLTNSISNRFIGIFLIFLFLEKLMTISISQLVMIAPPLINVFLLLLVFLIAQQLQSTHIALISLMIFGWENQILVFGHDFRTQTIGTLLLYCLIFVILIYPRYNTKVISLRILSIFLICGIVTTSFVSIVVSLISIIGMYLSEKLANKFNKNHLVTDRINILLILIFLVLFFFYLFYIGITYNGVITAILSLFHESASELAELSKNQVAIGAKAEVYGHLNALMHTSFLMLFALSSIYYSLKNIKDINKNNIIFLGAFLFVMLFMLSLNFMGHLNIARIFIINFIFFSVSFSVAINKVASKINQKKLCIFFRILVYTIVLLFVLTSAVKLPNYIIGETNPIRSVEPIDTITYWNSDLPLSWANNFIERHFINGSVKYYSNSWNYLLYTILLINNDKVISVLHDKFCGKTYSNRQDLPPLGRFNNYSKIYSSSDYLVFV